MLGRVLWVGLLAGLAAGLATAVLQHVTTTPLILVAETYETAAPHQHGALPGHGVAGAVVPGAVLAGRALPDGAVRVAHNHGTPAATATDASAAPAEADEGWKPADGWQRTAVTALATVLTSIGWALVLIAGMLIAGDRITVRSAIDWGAAAFAATGLATGLGLAPELPGSAAGDLVARQVWWIGTAAASAAGLYGLLRLQSIGARIGSLILIAIPHLVGAPHPAKYESTVPAELAAHFAASSLALTAAMWMLIACAVGMIWERSAHRA